MIYLVRYSIALFADNVECKIEINIFPEDYCLLDVIPYRLVDSFLLNIGTSLSNYVMSHPRQLYSSLLYSILLVCELWDSCVDSIWLP